MKTYSWKGVIAKIIVYAILIAIVISIFYPFVFMIVNSFKERSEYYANIFGLPRAIQFTNYRVALERFDIFRLGLHSLIVTVCSIVINSLVSSMAAFGLSKLPFRGSNTIQMLILGCMMIPGQVLMVPVYLIMSAVGLINSFASVILYFVASSIPFAVFMLNTQCSNIPNGVLEAAEIDGASPPKIFINIIFPLLKPSVVTLVILNFLTFWNELLYSMLFLQTESTRTLTVEITTSIGRYTSNMPLLMTGLMINCIPTILIFIIFQNQIAKGVTAGAVK